MYFGRSVDDWFSWKSKAEARLKEESASGREFSIFVDMFLSRRQDTALCREAAKLLSQPDCDGFKKLFWKKFVVCLASTQAASGPKTLIQQLAKTDPKTLPVEENFLDPDAPLLKEALGAGTDALKAAIDKALGSFKLRNENNEVSNQHNRNLVGQLSESYTYLFKDNGKQFCHLEQAFRTCYAWSCAKTGAEMRKAELVLCDELQKLAGIGPNQSRNLLQFLGLSQKILPIDSRWRDLLAEEVKVTYETAYRKVEEQLLALAVALCLQPYELDALAFVWMEKE